MDVYSLLSGVRRVQRVSAQRHSGVDIDVPLSVDDAVYRAMASQYNSVFVARAGPGTSPALTASTFSSTTSATTPTAAAAAGSFSPTQFPSSFSPSHHFASVSASASASAPSSFSPSLTSFSSASPAFTSNARLTSAISASASAAASPRATQAQTQTQTPAQAESGTAPSVPSSFSSPSLASSFVPSGAAAGAGTGAGACSGAAGSTTPVVGSVCDVEVVTERFLRDPNILNHAPLITHSALHLEGSGSGEAGSTSAGAGAGAGSECSALILGDELRLQQILLNLTSNSLKFTTRGHVRIGAQVLARSATHITLRFFVADSGMGIAEANMSKLFQSYSQEKARSVAYWLQAQQLYI